MIDTRMRFGEPHVNLGRTQLLDFPCYAGFMRYLLTAQSAPIAVPEPAAILLLATDTAAALVRRRRSA